VSDRIIIGLLKDTPDPIPAALQIWWDRNQRLWGTRIVDAEGNQIGDVQWDFSKAARAITIKSLKLVNPNLPLQKLRPCSL
jgi:hypothetical protein